MTPAVRCSKATAVNCESQHDEVRLCVSRGVIARDACTPFLLANPTLLNPLHYTTLPRKSSATTTSSSSTTNGSSTAECVSALASVENRCQPPVPTHSSHRGDLLVLFCLFCGDHDVKFQGQAAKTFALLGRGAGAASQTTRKGRLSRTRGRQRSTEAAKGSPRGRGGGGGGGNFVSLACGGCLPPSWLGTLAGGARWPRAARNGPGLAQPRHGQVLVVFV